MQTTDPSEWVQMHGDIRSSSNDAQEHSQKTKPKFFAIKKIEEQSSEVVCRDLGISSSNLRALNLRPNFL